MIEIIALIVMAVLTILATGIWLPSIISSSDIPVALIVIVMAGLLLSYGALISFVISIFKRRKLK